MVSGHRARLFAVSLFGTVRPRTNARFSGGFATVSVTRVRRIAIDARGWLQGSIEPNAPNGARAPTAIRTARLTEAVALIGDLEAGKRVPGKALILMD
jgi:hypothetical protein